MEALCSVMARKEAKGMKGIEEREGNQCDLWDTRMSKEPLHIHLQTEVEPLQRMFEKFINKMLIFKKDNCNELVPLPEYSGIISLCKLYSALATPENGVRGTRAGPGRKAS